MDPTANFTVYSSGCSSPTAVWSIFTAWFSVYLLFLPVFLFVLYIAFNKWKKPQSSASGGLSHSDVFTLNMVAMEMISIAGAAVGLYGVSRQVDNVRAASGNLTSIIFTGQTLFHSLTCVERYLAVVHPVTYLRLRGEGGVTIRNISIALVWALSASFCVIGRVNSDVTKVYCFALMLLVVPLVAYCSIYVLRVLIRPKPGDASGGRMQIGESKRTTVYIMGAIMLALKMRLIVSFIDSYLPLRNLGTVDVCLLGVASNWFSLPSSLVLPVLFLHRARKLFGKARK